MDPREVLDDPEIANVWRLYRAASEEADHDEDARDRTRSDRVLRFALRRGYSPLDAVRAARGDATLRKVDVENDADYQRARRSPPRARKPRSATCRGAFWEVMVVEAIRYELIRAGYTDH